MKDCSLYDLAGVFGNYSVETLISLAIQVRTRNACYYVSTSSVLSLIGLEKVHWSVIDRLRNTKLKGSMVLMNSESNKNKFF